MRRDAALKILHDHEPELRAAGVRSLILFGSVARDEATESSDVDLVVDFDHPVGYFAIFRLKARLEAWLGRRVDLTMQDAVRPELEQRIDQEGLRAA